DGDDLYLDPEAAFAEAQGLGEGQGERLTVTQRQLYKRLKERGLLICPEKDRLTSRRMLQGLERSVLHLRTSCLTSQKPGVSGVSGDELASETPKPPKPPVSGDDRFASPTGNGDVLRSEIHSERAPQNNPIRAEREVFKI